METLNQNKTLQETFFLNEITEFLEKHPNNNSIALQFPDSLLSQSVKIFKFLKQAQPSRCFYILGDSSYAECCVDDVNASHAKSNDMIIKFGRHCLSTASKSKQCGNKQILYVLSNNTEVDFTELR